MEEIKIRELPDKSHIETTDFIPIESIDGTKKVLVKHFRSMVLTSLYFNSINDLKNSPEVALREGDVVETLGYNNPGDGGGAKYQITYNPAAVEDGKLVHYLSYSDTLRAEIITADKINVHQFGAVGDGVTDDTDAIQAAIDNSESKIIEFNNNQTYVIRRTLKINKSNTIINGNGATLAPYYVDGIDISPEEEVASSDFISDIIINNLHFDCARAVSGIKVYESTKVDLNECNFNNISSKGINIKNCSFVNVEKCMFNSKNTGSCIVMEGEERNKCKFININNCKFLNFSKGIYIYNTGAGESSETTVNITNCEYSNVSDSTCIYISAPIELINIRSNNCEMSTTFLYFGGASRGNVTCRDIYCLGTTYIFDIGTTYGALTLDGTIIADTLTIFNRMMGKLHSNIIWDITANGASFVNPPIGELFDAIYPTQYSTDSGYSIYESTLTLSELRNMHVDWSSSTHNLTEIVNGVKGQLLYIKSSTRKSIISDTNKIILSKQSTQLGTYNGILLRYDGLQWVQVEEAIPVAFSNNNEMVALSTYDTWKSLGNEGGPQDFINDLKGDVGENGTGIANITSEVSDDGTITFKFLLDNGETKTTSVTLPSNGNE